MMAFSVATGTLSMKMTMYGRLTGYIYNEKIGIN